MYMNRFEYLIEAGNRKKDLQENLGNITAERDSFERVQYYQYFNMDLQHISNKDPTQKLNVVNEVLATKEAIEYHLTKKYSCFRKQLQVETIAHLLISLRQYEGQAHN